MRCEEEEKDNLQKVRSPSKMILSDIEPSRSSLSSKFGRKDKWRKSKSSAKHESVYRGDPDPSDSKAVKSIKTVDRKPKTENDESESQDNSDRSLEWSSKGEPSLKGRKTSTSKRIRVQGSEGKLLKKKRYFKTIISV